MPVWFPFLFYLLLAACFLWRSTFTGEVFLPAGLLGHIAPWSANAPSSALPPWNPLRWDGIAQFYPWRHFAAQTLHQGRLPLWNPYQFCGTPFVANSQSAVFYPGNLLFYLLPTARAFGVSALLHLTLCGWTMYLFLRRLRVSEWGSLLGGVVYAYSAWQVAWLQLPTFLATSCWFPLLLRQILVIREEGRGIGKGKREEGSIFHPSSFILHPSLAAVIGLILLAGHLQIAFYGLLAGSLWAVALLIAQFREQGVQSALRMLLAYSAALVLGILLAMPQLLPVLELSRISHRAAAPTAESYQAYVDYALHPAGLMTLSMPEFFGGDSDANNPYWGYYTKEIPGGPTFAIRHNAAETAWYVGIVPLLLAIFALVRGLKRKGGDRRVLFFALLALLALLLSFGTPLDALFYFGLPGFGQSGSPARSLVLWALALAVLSGIGLDFLQAEAPTKRESGITASIFVFLIALGLNFAAQSILQAPQGMPAGLIPVSIAEAFGRIGAGWIRLLAMSVGGLTLLFVPKVRRWVPGIIALVVLDLFWAGIRANPTAPIDSVYPETPTIALLKQRVSPHERIFPVNHLWSLYSAPLAVLPPNAAMVYGLRDVQGYDSLLTGQYKRFADTFALPDATGHQDASPPQVGNMVFFQNPNAPLAPYTSAQIAITPRLEASATPLPGSALASENTALYSLPNARPRAQFVTPSGDTPLAAPVTWREDSPTRVTLEGVTNAPAVLNLNDQFYPGWRALVDGKDVPIARQQTASIFRAIPLPAPGHHVIQFRYEPASFRVGLYLACFACLLISGVQVFRYSGVRRK